MRIVHGFSAAEFDGAAGALSIGNFDGVHLGHRQILDCAAERARQVRGPLVVMTFDPHPLAVLRPDRAPPMLTPPDEKLAQLAAAGVDATVVVAADRAFLSLTADDFVREVVVGRFRPRWVIEGPSFNYGRDRGGDNETLRLAGREHGFDVCVVESVEVEVDPGRHEMVSSSLIRRAVAAGDVELAERALGRPYALLGPVVEGRRRGRTLGYPTANLDVGRQLLPAEGVYAGVAFVGGARYDAAVSIGRAPTFGETATLVEAHLLDFDGDLYDKRMRLELRGRIRGQATFPSAKELRAQIDRDVADIRSLLGRTGIGGGREYGA